MKTFKQAMEDLNDKYFEDFDLYRNDDFEYTDERMLEILKQYKAEYLEICAKYPR